MKYMGSKNRIAKYIIPIMLKDRKEEQYFVEPFCGGCNLIDKVQNPRIGNDSNKYLIALLSALDTFDFPYISKQEYIDIREHHDKYSEAIVGYTGIVASYCGKWFGGYAGKTTTKDGVRDYMQEGIINLKKQAVSLRGCIFQSNDYAKMTIPKGSIVYCDPPYKGTTGYKDKFDHEEFYVWLKEIAKQNTVFVSEYSMPEFADEIWAMQLSSSLSANGITGENKKSVEKLFRIKEV